MDTAASKGGHSRAATIGGVRAPVCNDCAGRGRAPTAGLQHAPSGSVDAVERVTRGLRIESLVAAAACALTRGSLSLLDRLPPPPSSARTARTCRSRTAWSTVSRRGECGRRTRGHLVVDGERFLQRGSAGVDGRCEVRCDRWPRTLAPVKLVWLRKQFFMVIPRSAVGPPLI